MEIILGTLLNAQPALATLYQQSGLNSVTAYRIAKLTKAADEEIKNYNDQRIKLCEQYANKDEKGKPIINDGNYDISEKNMEKYIEELTKLLEETVELPDKKVSLEDIDCAGLSPALLDTIEFVLQLEDK